MAAPMRETPLDGGHRAKVADPRAASQQKAADQAANNFEYDDNEWDIGIGDLIIDLDADIEKTNEKGAAVGGGPGGMSAAATAVAAAGGGAAAGTGAPAKGSKMAVEHSATVDKGLKMKIKRTKPGTKTSEAKHEIVKSGEQNGADAADGAGAGGGGGGGASNKKAAQSQQSGGTAGGGGSKRGSSGHRRDKARDKHGGGGGADKANKAQQQSAATPPASTAPAPAPPPQTQHPQPQQAEVNGTARSPAGPAPAALPPPPQPSPQAPARPPTPPPQAGAAATPAQQPPPPAGRVVFPGPGPGPPLLAAAPGPPPPSPPVLLPPLPAPTLTPVKSEPPPDQDGRDDCCSPPPAKKVKTEPKDMLDVCVGTSVGTITEPDCLGPCEPGTSVTLEGIVWHETEGGVLVVNVTWRGKTYVGTLLDCTRHDWAPPRFCDSPTSDLDARTPKGRGKRGRAAASTTPGSDLSNFTETRSSVHSKLRNGGAKGRRGAASGSSNPSTGSTGTGSPTPFVSPKPETNNKRKGRSPEEESPNAAKKNRIPPPPPPSGASSSPPSSPVLLECPEPNCSKKYKHINGLKYHQSHAHGSAEDEDTKDAASTSENDESNAEAPSPAPSLKSPEKQSDVQLPKKEEMVNGTVQGADSPSVTQDPPSQPATPKSGIMTPPTPQQLPPAVPAQVTTAPPELVSTPVPPVGTVSSPDTKSLVKPGVLRFVPPVEDFPVGVFCNNKQVLPPAGVSSNGASVSAIRGLNVGVPQSPNPPPIPPQNVSQAQLQSQSVSTQPQQQPQQQQHLQQPQQQPAQLHQPPLQQQPPQQQQPGPALPLQQPQLQGQSLPQPQTVPLAQSQLQAATKQPQFKVKSTASLMPDDKKDRTKLQGHKKKNRKSPAGSPHPQPEQPSFGLDASNRDDVQSPAYSDISDDAAPVLESEMGDGKGKVLGADKKGDINQGPSPHSLPHYGMYPFFGQPPYLVPSVQDAKPKENSDKMVDNKGSEKDKKDVSSGEYQQKLIQQHFYPYGYVPGYHYGLEANYQMAQIPPEDKIKEIPSKDDKSPSPIEHTKQMPSIPSPIQVPNPAKIKSEQNLGMKDKHQNENHQILKESIEMKSQMNSYVYSRQQQQHHPQDDLRRFYLYPEQQQQPQPPPQVQQQQQQQQQQVPQQQQQQPPPQQPRRKDSQGVPESSAKSSTSLPKPATLSSPSHKHKEKVPEEKKEEKVKQEGVKPTMETQGPPPPPTSSYAYIHHPGYMQPPHYGALPFDPSHTVYRSVLVPGPYGTNPYLHPQLPRYPHAPEDLSRPPSGPAKALDLLQHHASQYAYASTHKIHELQERALKSPTPKAPASAASPSGPVGPLPAGGPQQAVGPGQPPPGPPPGPVPPAPPGKQVAPVPGSGADGKEARSPPPQRHVHTHHHTHVGLGYPILAGQYSTPYGAAVLASQQAAAVAATVINPYPPK